MSINSSSVYSRLLSSISLNIGFNIAIIFFGIPIIKCYIPDMEILFIDIVLSIFLFNAVKIDLNMFIFL